MGPLFAPSRRIFLFPSESGQPCFRVIDALPQGRVPFLPTPPPRIFHTFRSLNSSPQRIFPPPFFSLETSTRQPPSFQVETSKHPDFLLSQNFPRPPPPPPLPKSSKSLWPSSSATARELFCLFNSHTHRPSPLFLTLVCRRNPRSNGIGPLVFSVSSSLPPSQGRKSSFWVGSSAEYPSLPTAYPLRQQASLFGPAEVSFGLFPFLKK